VAPEISVWVRVLFRIAGLIASEEELGDLFEEYAGARRGTLWLCRHLLSTVLR